MANPFEFNGQLPYYEEAVGTFAPDDDGPQPNPFENQLRTDVNPLSPFERRNIWNAVPSMQSPRQMVRPDWGAPEGQIPKPSVSGIAPEPYH